MDTQLMFLTLTANALIVFCGGAGAVCIHCKKCLSFTLITQTLEGDAVLISITTSRANRQDTLTHFLLLCRDTGCVSDFKLDVSLNAICRKYLGPRIRHR